MLICKAGWSDVFKGSIWMNFYPLILALNYVHPLRPSFLRHYKVDTRFSTTFNLTTLTHTLNTTHTMDDFSPIEFPDTSSSQSEPVSDTSVEIRFDEMDNNIPIDEEHSSSISFGFCVIAWSAEPEMSRSQRCPRYQWAPFCTPDCRCFRRWLPFSTKDPQHIPRLQI